MINKIALNVKSEGTENLWLFSQGMYNFQNLGDETLVIADYKCVKISKFAVLYVKLWLNEDNVLLKFCTFK